MMHRLWGASMTAGTVFVLAASAACEDEMPPLAQVCAPGEVRLCSGPARCAGTRTCGVEGQGFGFCICDPDAAVPASSDASTNDDAQ